MEKCGWCGNAFPGRVVMHTSGICLSPGCVMQKDAGEELSWPSLTGHVPTHLVCALLSLHCSQFWALAVQIMLCELFCLSHWGHTACCSVPGWGRHSSKAFRAATSTQFGSAPKWPKFALSDPAALQLLSLTHWAPGEIQLMLLDGPQHSQCFL